MRHLNVSWDRRMSVWIMNNIKISYYNRIEISEGTYVKKTSWSK